MKLRALGGEMSNRRHNLGLIIMTVVGAPYVVGYIWPRAGVVLLGAAALGLLAVGIVSLRARKTPPVGTTLLLLWCAILAPVGFTTKRKEERVAAVAAQLEDERLAAKRERAAEIARENEVRAGELAQLRRGHGAVLCMDSSYAPARCSCHDMHGCCVNNGGVARCEQD